MATETDYAVKSSAWKMLDYANPAWRPVDHSDRGKSLQASYTVRPDESAEQYWARVRSDVIRKANVT